MHTKWGHGAYTEVMDVMCCTVHLVSATPFCVFIKASPSCHIKNNDVYVCSFVLFTTELLTSFISICNL